MNTNAAPIHTNPPAAPSDPFARGQALHRANRFVDALELFREAVAANPAHAEAQFWLGATFVQLNRLSESIAPLRATVALRPNLALGWKLLAIALGIERANDAETEAAHQRAAALAPTDPSVHCNHGTFHLHRGQLDNAIAHLRRAIAIAPNHALAIQNLANALFEIGQHAEALTLQRRALELAPNDARFGSNLLLNLNYLDDVTPEHVFAAHVEWARRFSAAVDTAKRVHRNDRDRSRRLRIGYLSPDFRNHAVVSFIENVFESHDRSQFEVAAYFNAAQGDDVTARLRSLVDRWRDIVNLSDVDAAKLIEDDAIDILIDLAGHTNGNRATLLSRSPAPIQFTYLGYPNTTGLPQVDYRITDALADPPGVTEQLHAESLVRLPDTFLCYRPAPEAPPPLPQTPASSANGVVTFGSFNNFSKITDAMLDTWATIVARTPRSRMTLKSRALSSDAARHRVLAAFRKHGVKANRISFHPWVAIDQRHSIVASVDVALDTFPYNGTTTTCETLWLGVPCITRAGTTHVSRVSASILTTIGHHELIADLNDSYVRKAIELAADVPRLNAYRAGLRGAMSRSPLMDASRFTRHLETAYRAAWQRWCETNGESA